MNDDVETGGLGPGDVDFSSGVLAKQVSVESLFHKQVFLSVRCCVLRVHLLLRRES